MLRPGGTLVVVDNDYAAGEFADILRVATQGNAAFDPDATDRWWRARGAHRIDVMSQWRFERRAISSRCWATSFVTALRPPGSMSILSGYP